MNAVGKTLIVIGIIVFVLGVVFSLQSKSLVGPTSSFMYDNPEWTVNGFIVIVSGIFVVVIGGLVTLFHKRKSVG